MEQRLVQQETPFLLNEIEGKFFKIMLASSTAYSNKQLKNSLFVFERTKNVFETGAIGVKHHKVILR